MSIIFDTDDGWIISHLCYLHSIYELVQDGHKDVKLEFNDAFFKVNSPYLRQNQVDKCKYHTKVTVKRKNTHNLPQNILEQNNFVQATSAQLIKAAKDNNLFTEIVTQDNNEESRLQSNKFYLDKLDPTCNYQGRNETEKATIVDFQGKRYVFPKHCQFICNDVRKMSEKLDLIGDYDLILMDPPWWNKSIRRKKAKFEGSSYQMLYNKELSEIPIKSLLNSNSIIAVWCTNAPSHEKSILEEMFPAWGVTFKAKWFWLKVTQNGDPICDFNSKHGKQPYEQIIFGSVASNASLNVPDKKIIISVPSAAHSHKPPLAEILKPYLPKYPKCIEIFARYLLPGWSSWGLEVLKFQHASLFSVVALEK